MSEETDSRIEIEAAGLLVLIILYVISSFIGTLLEIHTFSILTILLIVFLTSMISLENDTNDASTASG